MTIYGWDTSHFDGRIDAATARRAVAEGIAFATAKVGEGGTYDDPADGGNLAAFRDAGVPLIGGYYVPRTPGDPVADQVAHCIALADRDEPWWRTFPGWFWQVDLETWGYDNVAASTGIAFGTLLATRTGRVAIMYASHGEYGNRLTAWVGPLWNANYPSGAHAPFKDLYPGDHYAGWDPYSGQVPAICQYASTAIIAGMTTCDANAYRGTLAELTALLTGGSAMSLTATDAHTVWASSLEIPDARTPATDDKVTPATGLARTWEDVLAVNPHTDAAVTAAVTAINAHTDAAVGAIVVPGGSLTQADLDAIRTVVRDEVAAGLATLKITTA